jgi:uncharacterized membrane protein YphA (DoxX/SURF4 family)
MNDEKKEKVLGVVRHVLTFLGGVLVMKGLITEEVFAEVAGAAVTLIGAIWSIASKNKDVAENAE